MNSPTQSRYDVVISGAGPCGAALANMLGTYGVSTLLIDLEPDILMLPRAVGMCDEGSRILDSFGIFDNDPVDLLDIGKIYFSDKDSNAVFHFDTSKKINEFSMQRTFYQPRLEQSLRSGLQRFDCVEFSASTELARFEDDGEQVALTLRKSGQEMSIDCKFLVGCDGSRSPIRKHLGIGFCGTTYSQDWLIIDIANNPIPSSDVYFSIDPSRPGITLPLPKNRRRWEFVVKESDTEQELYSDAMLEQLLSPWGNYHEMEVERKAIYTFHARVAEKYRVGNVFLAGDAAHITPPFAGQGMMAGFRDAHNLSWKLAGVLNKTLSSTILDTYDTERIPHSKQIVNFAKFIGGIVLPQSRVKAWIRDSFIRLSKWLRFYTKEEGARMDKIPNHINGSLLRNAVISRTRGTGIWFPQHPLSRQGECRSADSWMKPGFRIISWEQDVHSLLTRATKSRWSALRGESSVIAMRDGDDRLGDYSGEYQTFFKPNSVAVVRPDKMMVVRCEPQELDEQLNRYLDEICVPTQRAA